MDPKSSQISDSVSGCQYYNENILRNSDQYPDLGSNIPSPADFCKNPYFSSDPCPNDSSQSLIWTGTRESLRHTSDENDSSNPVLKYITQVLMEENMEDKPSMFLDPLALQQTEEMLYQVIGESQTQTNSPQDGVFSTGSDDFEGTTNSGTSTSSNTDMGNFANYQMVIDPFGDSHFGSNLEFPSSNGLPSLGDGLVGSLVNDHMIQKMFGDPESVLQFKKGLEEASKFLPSSNQLVISLETNENVLKGEPKESSKLFSAKEESSGNSSRGRKNHEREETDLEETRSNKQTAVNVEDGELTEIFDAVLLVDGKCKQEFGSNPWKNFPDGKSPANNHDNEKKKEKNKPVDFQTLLILCAQAISAGDNKTAYGLLKQIREESSPVGDASQRLAHCFANGLEARLIGCTGRGIQSSYNILTLKKTTATDVLKSYKVYLSASPFKTFLYFFGNRMILDAAENSSILHIVDFGILYGFQWPMLIQHLSKREGGPPKLRITGIELPQRGFRPAERIEETGRRLAKYCERFNVPFEYNPIASQNWEKIRIDDLKIRRNEILAVNCSLRFTNLLDETADEENCQRNDVLKLIREMNPDVFVHSILNGCYNAPFFATRFKEALFSFSAFFDMLDCTLPRDCQERLMFEREFYGRQAMNVIACEGLERVERPETYKQWQMRMVRAGFSQKKVDKELVEKFRGKSRMWYHKDFVMDEDGDWFLQGWKGRIICASSCWVPA